MPAPLIAAIEATELVYEAYLLVRRVLAFKAVVDSSLSVFSNDDDYVADLKNHRTLPGEEIYLYLLGSTVLQKINFDPGETKPSLIAVAIAASIKERTSNDIPAVINGFLFHLGAVCQKADSNFKPTLEKFISNLNLGNGYSYLPNDPVFTYVQSWNGQLPANEVHNISSLLSVPSSTVEATCQALANKKFKAGWNKKFISKYAESKRVFHKSSLIYVQLLAGASSEATSSTSTVDLTYGRGGLRLSLFTFAPEQVSGRRRFIFPDVRSINPQLIKQTELQDMARRGYEQLSDKTWAYKDEIQIVSQVDRNGLSTDAKVRIPPAVIERDEDAPKKSQADQIITSVTNKLSSKAQDKVVDLVIKSIFKS